MNNFRISAFLAAATLWLALISGPAFAVRPDEILSDPVLEARARTLSEELRCMVCQNQSIDESDADLARDLRLLVRERLKAGDSDDEVMDYIVSRYGEFVLLKPRFDLKNALLWGTPVLLLLAGGLVILRASRSKKIDETAALTAQEQTALDEVLRRGE